MSGKFDKYLGKFREKDSVEGGASGVQTVNGVSPNDSGNVEVKAKNISTVSGKNVEESILAAMPAGTVIAYAGSSAPEGFITCNGAAVSRTTYADLFAAIGTLYGSGDGATTFNLPDLTDRVVQGSATAGTALAAGLPNITGRLSGATLLTGAGGGADITGETFGSGALTAEGGGYYWQKPDTGNRGYIMLYLDASKSNTIYGNSTTVQPPALTMIYCIKY